MARRRLKIGLAGGLMGAELANSVSKNLPPEPSACSLGFRPLHQRRISRQKVWLRGLRARIPVGPAKVLKLNERSPIHLSHAGSDQDLPASKKVLDNIHLSFYPDAK